jgi:PAS domain S-box-containing protein
MLLETIPIPVFYKGRDGKYLGFNKAFEDFLGKSRKDLIGKTVFDINPPELAKIYHAQDTELLEEPGIQVYESQVLDAHGVLHDVVFHKVSLTDAQGSVTGLVGAVLDFTERKQSEEQIHVLSQELIRAHERERQMISLELHDRVAQDLSTVKIGLDTLIHSWPEADPVTRRQILDLSNLVQGAIIAVRDLAYDLRPPSLDRLGLIQSVYQYCEEFSEKTGLTVDFTCAGIEDLRLDPDTEINLYRLVQEGLINVRKHAEAAHVVVRLVASFPSIILRIVDDGRGFDVEKRRQSITSEKRMGLRSMGERVRLLGGEIDIKSSPGKGTRVVIQVPIREKEDGIEEDPVDRG